MLFEGLPYFQSAMEYNKVTKKKFEQFKILDIVFNSLEYYLNISIIVSIAINVFIIASLYTNNRFNYLKDPEGEPDWEIKYALFYITEYETETTFFLYILAYLQCYFSIMIFINYLVKNFPKYNYGLKKEYKDNEDKLENTCERAMAVFFRFVLRLFSDYSFHYYYFYIAFAFAAAFWNLNFSLFHIIEYLNRSVVVNKVFQAMWGPKIQLINSIILLGILIYWFSIFTYLFFYDHLPGAIGYNFKVTFFKIIDWTWKVIYYINMIIYIIYM